MPFFAWQFIAFSSPSKITLGIAQNNAIRCADFTFFFLRSLLLTVAPLYFRLSSDVPLLLKSPMLHLSRLPSSLLFALYFSSSVSIEREREISTPVDFIIYYIEETAWKNSDIHTYLQVQLKISAIVVYILIRNESWTTRSGFLFSKVTLCHRIITCGGLRVWKIVLLAQIF